MFYADSFTGTSGYSKVVRELAQRIGQYHDVFVQELVTVNPTTKYGNVTVLPVYGPRGSELYLSSIVNHMNLIKPDMFLPICDPFLMVNDGIANINYGDMQLLPYITIDSRGVPDTSEQILNKACDIMVTSEYGKAQLTEEGYDATRLWHGVDMNIFKPCMSIKKIEYKKERGFDSDDIIFLHIGRNFGRKRHFRLVESIAKFNKKMQDEGKENKAKFLFHAADINMKEFNLQSFIKRMEKRYGIKLDNIIRTEDHQLGKGVSELDLVKLYQLSDFYITASSGEGFGIPIIEAFATKLPVILADNSTAQELGGDSRSIIVDNEGFVNTGWGTQQPLVCVNKLSETIYNSVHMSTDDKQKITDKAYSWVQTNCNWDKIALDMLQVINKNLRGKK